VTEVVREFEHDVLHKVENDHFEEVVLFEGLGQDDLVRHLSVFVALLFDDLLLAGEYVFARTRVEYDDNCFHPAYVPVEALDVAYLNHIRVADPHVVELGQVALHFVDHAGDLLAQPRHAFVQDDPLFECAFA